MGQSIIQVDSFTNTPFAGNPAGVCVMDGPADESWMQAVAMEMNLSETAFLYPRDTGYSLRWFTPICEVPLCGHATLASAHVLFADGHVPGDREIAFDTKSGRLGAAFDGGWIRLNFPATPIEETTVPDGLESALGAEIAHIVKAGADLLAEFTAEETVRRLDPDFTALARFPVKGVIVTAAGSGDYDCVSRFFAPSLGINEDPVTGAAHCAIAPYWHRKLGRTELTAFQASARGGMLRLKLAGDRIDIFGQAVITIRGELV